MMKVETACDRCRRLEIENEILKLNAGNAFQAGINAARALYKEDEVRMKTAKEIFLYLQKMRVPSEYGDSYFFVQSNKLKELAEEYGAEIEI